MKYFNYDAFRTLSNITPTTKMELKLMRYMNYIRKSEKEIADAFASGDPAYAMAEITRIEEERHEYHDIAIEAVKALNIMAHDAGIAPVYAGEDYRRDYITAFCEEYEKEVD